MEKITTYGSLLEGAHAHHILKDSKLIRRGVIDLPYKMVDFGEFPALLKDTKTNPVYVETYEVSDEVFKEVERYEGYPAFYIRVKLEDGSYIYIIDNIPSKLYENFEHIQNWLEYKGIRDIKYYFVK